MATIRMVDTSAKQRLKSQSKGYQEREPYRAALRDLKLDGLLEFVPDSGETLRKIKLNLARAAREVGRSIGYGETVEKSVLAWLKDSDGAPRKRRGRRPKAATAG